MKFQYFDEYSRDCEVWLAKNYKAEYHVVDELRGAPTLSNSGLDDKSPPLLVGAAGLASRHVVAAGEKVEKAGSESARPSGSDDAPKKPAKAGRSERSIEPAPRSTRRRYGEES